MRLSLLARILLIHLQRLDLSHGRHLLPFDLSRVPRIDLQPFNIGRPFPARSLSLVDAAFHHRPFRSVRQRCLLGDLPIQEELQDVVVESGLAEGSGLLLHVIKGFAFSFTIENGIFNAHAGTHDLEGRYPAAPDLRQ